MVKMIEKRAINKISKDDKLTNTVKKTTAITKDTIKQASDLQETNNKFDVVMGDNSKRVDEWAKKYSLTMGQSYSKCFGRF